MLARRSGEAVMMEENSAYAQPVGCRRPVRSDEGVKTKKNSAYAGARLTTGQEPVYEEITDFCITHNSAYGCHGHGGASTS